MYRVSLLFAALTVCGFLIQCQAQRQLHTGVIQFGLAINVNRYLRTLTPAGSFSDDSGERFGILYRLTNLRLSRYPYVTPTVTSPSTNTYQWRHRIAQVAITGDWSSFVQAGPVLNSGTWTATVNGINFDTTLVAGGTRAFITGYSCSIGYISLTSPVSVFRQTVERHLRDELELRVCLQMRNIFRTLIDGLLQSSSG